MREETILNYQNLVYKILSHYRNLYNYNRDFEEDYFHDGMVALIHDIIPSKEEKILDMLIKKETKEELEDSLNNLSNDDNFIICSLYGIKTKKITQKNLAKIINCTQSCIAKKHNKILNLIKEYLEY